MDLAAPKFGSGKVHILNSLFKVSHCFDGRRHSASSFTGSIYSKRNISALLQNNCNGPKELCGAVDLLSHYKLWPHHEIFCKRSLPVPLSETPYLRNVVGDKKIRKGEGMELDQLLHETSCKGDGRKCLQPFQLDILREAFQITEMTTFDYPYVERGIHLPASKLKIGSKNEKKHRRHQDRETKKKKDPKMHKQHHKDASLLKENGENRVLVRKFHPHQLVKQRNNRLK